MKRALKRISAAVLTVVLLLTAIPFTASAATYSGTCGENLRWTFDESTGTLTINGEGDLSDFDFF